MLYHMHALIKIHAKNPKALDTEGLKDWVRTVIEHQKMEIVNGPFVTNVTDAGNEGPTGGCHIKTSHFAFHIWEETGLIQADLYTCGVLDVQALVEDFLVFDPIHIEYAVINREDTIQLVHRGEMFLDERG